MSDPTHIDVRGAHAHNLKGVDVSVPRDALVVFTGVSGSGKSSLAFDTIFREGQRRFVESLSAYARQFLGQLRPPAVEEITGLSPTLSIDQKTVNRNPRSTVGTITEIYDHLRLLMARLGQARCPRCGHPVERLSVGQVVDQLLTGHAGQRLQVLGPLVRERKGEYRKELDGLRRDGWVRVRADGQLRTLDEDITLARYERHTIEVVVDRLRARESDRGRLAEALDTAFGLGSGVAVVLTDAGEHTFSLERGCPHHPELSLPELEPRLFSFNTPQGACPTCQGLGVLERFDPERVCDHQALPANSFRALNDDGRLPFTHFDRDTLARMVGRLGPADVPVHAWDEAARHRLLHGAPDVECTLHVVRDDGIVDVRSRSWRGLVGLVEHTWRWSSYPGFERFMARTTCPDCGGARLGEVSRAVRFRGRGISELASMTVGEARAFFRDLELAPVEAPVGELLVAELRDRLGFLHEVGLSYLSLDRSAATLSGGESQRIRLASQVGSGLQGVTYVLDEPSIGLHPRDNARMLGALRRLRDRGNAVLVVEHDAATIEAADHVVDVGPGPGRHGGEVVVSGSPARFLRSRRSVTAGYMRGERVIPRPDVRRTGDLRRLTVEGARLHNLRDLTVSLDLGTLTAITGVSGSGKSTLVFQVLERGLREVAAGEPLSGCRALHGVDAVDKVVRISQRPIGRTPRSNPATYTGVFTPIRALFAMLPESRARGWTRSRFSFNVAGGRCEACGGAGVEVVEMQFLPSVEVPCEVCEGRRFNAETLEVRWRGHTIHDVLELTVAEAAEVFRNQPAIARILDTMVEVGLGYVPLGQPSTTLSGGEAQRVKLATELHRRATGHTLYLLDEPTTGLHFEDVARLLAALDRLVDAGHTVVVVEHHLDVVLHADQVVDLGPEGGDGGGTLVGQGTPEHVATLDTPTGRALAAALAPVAAEPTRRRRRRRRSPRVLSVRGARKHNLQGIDVDLPHNRLTVVTGVSGSGKTSLAFGTLFAEGQRRYVESLSTYARRFLGRLDRAPLESVAGLAPAIAIDQRATSRNPRSTVATVTEIHDVLRLLWARVGQVRCPVCQAPVRGRSPSQAAAHLRAEAVGAGWLLAGLAPAAAPAASRDQLVADGWARLLDGRREVRLEDDAALPLLEAGATLVVDRLNPGKAARARLWEAVDAAYRLGRGRARFVARRGDASWLLTEAAVCPDHGPVFPEAPTPRHFSFNSRLGACPRCDGLGHVQRVVPERLLPRPELGLFDGMDGYVRTQLRMFPRHRALLEGLLAHLGLDADVPLAAWTADQRRALLDGLDEPLAIQWSSRWGGTRREVEEAREWKGLLGIIDGWRGEWAHLKAVRPCPECGGARLGPASRSVTVHGHTLPALSALAARDALEVVRGWEFTGSAATIAARPLLELTRRLGFLVDVGLGYLALDRAAHTLFGGEAQRIRLASQLGSRLVGVVYVLDEPTIGLHPRDTERLLGILEGLRDLGNTLVVVEHDPDTIRRADHVVDLGPGAGKHGGQVVAAGTPAQIEADPRSLTGRWLSGSASMPPRGARRRPRGWVTLREPRANNLRAAQVRLPTGVWLAVSGVSGSGKSSLIMDTLAPALQRHLGQDRTPGPHGGLEVSEPVDRVVVVDQTPLGRTPRSTPATYTKIMDGVRKVFAGTRGAAERGWRAGRFSFNAGVGRCPACEGRGAILVEMHFLPDVWVTCEACGGRRYERETLEVRWRGHSIADVLAMRVDEALELFANHRGLSRKLQALVDVGLGYLTLGQPADTLSGGEAQRVKLAAELTSRKGHAVYVLDEPTTGLHLADVARLAEVLHRLVDQGHTVITVEHHLDVLRQADWILDLGPEGGEEGGLVVGEGTPEEVGALDTPTGHALR